MGEVIVRPRWHRNLLLGGCLVSVLLLGGALAGMHSGTWRWLWVLLYAAMLVIWIRATVGTCVRCDNQGLRSDRPMSKLSATASWDEVARFVQSGGVVKAELRSGEPIVVLDPCGDAVWVTGRLEDERHRRQPGRSDAPSAEAPE